MSLDEQPEMTEFNVARRFILANYLKWLVSLHSTPTQPNPIHSTPLYPTSTPTPTPLPL